MIPHKHPLMASKYDYLDAASQAIRALTIKFRKITRSKLFSLLNVFDFGKRIRGGAVDPPTKLK